MRTERDQGPTPDWWSSKVPVVMEVRLKTAVLCKQADHMLELPQSVTTWPPSMIWGGTWQSSAIAMAMPYQLCLRWAAHDLVCMYICMYAQGSLWLIRLWGASSCCLEVLSLLSTVCNVYGLGFARACIFMVTGHFVCHGSVCCHIWGENSLVNSSSSSDNNIMLCPHFIVITM